MVDIIQRRDEIIFGNYDPNDYVENGMRLFFRLSVEKLKQLIEERLVEENSNFNNDAPSIYVFLAFAEKYGGRYAFSGYVYDKYLNIVGITGTKFFESYQEKEDFEILVQNADMVDIEYATASWN